MQGLELDLRILLLELFQVLWKGLLIGKRRRERTMIRIICVCFIQDRLEVLEGLMVLFQS